MDNFCAINLLLASQITDLTVIPSQLVTSRRLIIGQLTALLLITVIPYQLLTGRRLIVSQLTAPVTVIPSQLIN